MIPAETVAQILNDIPEEGISVWSCTPDMVSVFLAHFDKVSVVNERVYKKVAK